MENRYSRILPGESYIGIRALADFFCLRLKYSTSFVAPLLGSGSCGSFEPSHLCILFLFFFYHTHLTISPYHMISLQTLMSKEFVSLPLRLLHADMQHLPNLLVSPTSPHSKSPTPSSFLFIKTLKELLSMHMSIINIADLVELI